MKHSTLVFTILACLLAPGKVFSDQKAEVMPVQAEIATARVAVPRLIKFNGTLRDLTGKPLSGPVDVTFALYADETGGAPLWFETQTVQASSLGRYTVLLGAMTAQGLPLELFTAGEAHWLGVMVRGLPEQPRVLLVSVPYALKAGDAETLGGKPASAFMLATQAATDTAVAVNAGTLSGLVQASALTGGGTTPKAVTMSAGYLPVFTDALGNHGNSVMYQSGSYIGVGTTTPSAAFDLNNNVFMIGPKTSRPGMGGTMRFRDDSGTVRWSFGVPGTAGATDFFLYNNANGHAPFYIQGGAASYSLYMQANGNVGVGTNNPAQKLDVSGNLRIGGTGNGLIFPDGTKQTSAATGGGGAAGVASFNGRTGLVVSAGGDYAFNQIGGTVGSTQLNGTYSNALTLSSAFNVINGNGAGLTNVVAATATNADMVDGVHASGFAAAGSTAVLGANSFSATQTIASGDVTISSGNLDLPATSAAGAAGVITLNGAPFVHNFGAASNTFLGRNAGNFSMTGNSNTAVGSNSFNYNSSGGNNTAVGTYNLVQNTTGQYNTSVGYNTLYTNTTAGYNTAVGAGALGNNCYMVAGECGGQYNTAVGVSAGVTNLATDANTTGSYNTFIGSNSGPSTSVQLTNATAIGANAVVGASNSLVLGSLNGVNGATASVNVGIGTTIPTTTFQVAGGDLSTTTAGTGLIVKSPDGSKCARIGIDNSGGLVASPVACP